MDVSIIIVNYNTSSLLLECLKSIYLNSKDILFEIIVVDNASVDNSVQMVREAFPDVILIASERNLGFGKGNNLGIKRAAGKFVFFLNSDTILCNNAIKILAGYLKANPHAGICGGNLYTGNNEPGMSFSQTMPGFWTEIDLFFFGLISKLRYKKNKLFNYSGKPLEIDGFILGADMMISRKVLDEAGSFDPDFFLYYEEVELTWRVKKLGYKVVSVPSAKIIHLEKGSELAKESTARRAFQSTYLYYLKTGKKKCTRWFHYLFVLTAYQRIIIFVLTGRKTRVQNWLNSLAWERKYNYFHQYGTDMDTTNAAQN